ncbi:MAG: ABC transporter permease [Treponema sp.]|nr:ABC transporter permease [Treponema sp.]
MRFIFRRALTALLTLLLVSFLCFVAFGVIPGDPAGLVLGTEASTAQIEALREKLYLNHNIIWRYFHWLSDFCTGNAGNSIRFHGAPVTELVRQRLPVSTALALVSLTFILIIAVPVSLFSVRMRESRRAAWLDRLINSLTAVGISIPNFFLGVLFIWIFGIAFRLFSPGAYIDYHENFPGFLASLCFPALAIALPGAALLTRFLRNALLHELSSPYVRTAFCKGAGFSTVLRRHVLPNTLVPSLAVLGMIIAEIFSGNIVIEQVFAIPGLGRLLLTAILSRDYALIQSLVVYISWTVVLVFALIDIAIQVIDPRIRLREINN